jgi:hypothetical protein
MATDSTSTFTVTGNLSYTGPTLLLQGTGFNLGTWVLGDNSQATTANAFTSGTLTMQAGSTLTLIGAPTEKRMFDKITGAGTIQCQGGNNNFNGVAAANFQASGGTISVTAGNFNSLTLGGAYLGGSKITANTATLTNGFLNKGLQLSATNVILNGIVEIDNDGTALLASTTWTVPSTAKSAQITMTGGSSIQIAAGATVAQSANLQIVPGAPTTNKPTISMSGAWSSVSQLTIAEIPVSGTGSWTLSSTASMNLNSVVFTAKSIANNGMISTQVGSFNVGTVTGTGTITTSPINMVITHIIANVFTLNTGSVTISNATFTTLNLNNGVLGISSTAKLTTFNFQGGKLMGSGSAQATVSVKDTSVTGVATQTLNNVALTTNTFSLDCVATPVTEVSFTDTVA